MFREQRKNRIAIGREKDLNINRSGSAPPTVEGSLSAVGNLLGNPNFIDIDNFSSRNVVLTEEEIRSHPAYLSYYYSLENLNPRLPPPLLSKEDWRVAQRFQAAGSYFGGGDWSKKNLVDDGGSSSLFSMQPGLSVQKAEDELMELREVAARTSLQRGSVEWLNGGIGGVVGVSDAGMGRRRKSFADILQEGIDPTASLSGQPSRPTSCNAFGHVNAFGISSSYSSELLNKVESSQSADALLLGAAASSMSKVQNLSSTVPYCFASSAGASLFRNRTSDPHLVGRSLSPNIPPMVSNVSRAEKKDNVSLHGMDGCFPSMNELAQVADSLLSSDMSKKQPDYMAEKLVEIPHYADFVKENEIASNLNGSMLGFDGQINFPRRTSSYANLQSKINSSRLERSKISNIHYQADNFASMDLSGHTASRDFANQKLNLTPNNHLVTGSTMGSTEKVQVLRSSYGARSDFHTPCTDPPYYQFMQKNPLFEKLKTMDHDDSFRGRNDSNAGHGHGDSQEFQLEYLAALLAHQKRQYGYPLSGIYYRNSAFDDDMTNRRNLMPCQSKQVLHFPSALRSSAGGSSGSWYAEPRSNMEVRSSSSLLEEVKNNKTRSFELLDVVHHVVEFSMDQYGSRFIQQKLETASTEEKTKIFPEIIPLAHRLMTDVFGNYVIQKFFEHGTKSQRKKLASQLMGHVLPLTLQMYGCRVIQKALEVVDVDQQTKMVDELDGSVMKCVRDQNGNHVIQKCIECVPQDRIQFIISTFFGHVVALASHPYGCRVIQRVLEHCDHPNTQQIIMDEIMDSVCTLAQDQYGNYVIQHVLQHGKPQERSAVVNKLAGQIVKMSQQKFASNVVEKCLTFCGPEERQVLVKEMLGSTDENEPLQAMMKDPFGNYVVQKVLETCDDQSRELILFRIKVHLNTLKRYTYGKHIVSRVEKLLIAGERRSG